MVFPFTRAALTDLKEKKQAEQRLQEHCRQQQAPRLKEWAHPKVEREWQWGIQDKNNHFLKRLYIRLFLLQITRLKQTTTTKGMYLFT